MPKPIAAETADILSDLSVSQRDEMVSRYDELTALEQKQVQMGTTVPQLYGSLSRYIANPSTVSVETYKRMLDTDDTVGSGIDLMNLCMMARFGDYKHKSPEVTQMVKRALDRMEGSWHENLDDMFSAEWAGFSMTEQVWDFVNDFDGVPAFVPKKLVTYPPLTIVFSVDRHGELHENGIHQYQRYHNTFFNSYAYGIRGNDLDGFRPDLFSSIGDLPYPVRISADLSYLTVHMSRQKCIHLRSSSTGKFKNPYGRSILRRAYKNWVCKDAFIKMWLVAADRKGTPLIVGYVAPNDTVSEGQFDHATGRVTGGAKPIRADVALANTLRTIHNSSFIVVPGKKGETAEIDSVDVTGDLNVFDQGTEYFNKMIMRSLLIPPMMLGGDGGGSYALATEHAKLMNRVIDGKLKPYKQGIIDQFVQKIIRYNFPESVWKKDGFGEFTLEEFDVEVMEKLSNIYGQLTTGQWMTPEDQQDLDEVRHKMGLKPKQAKVLYGANGAPIASGGGDEIVEPEL